MERKSNSAPPTATTNRTTSINSWKTTGSSRSTSQSKLLRGKTDATKEIEVWAAASSSGVSMGLTRQSGQLSDNVTEQRMYHSRMLELSRARYRSLAQHSYEKRIFIEQQQRKSSIFRDLLKGIPLRSASDLQSCYPSKQKNARYALLSKFDASRTLGRSSEVDEEFEETEDKFKRDVACSKSGVPVTLAETVIRVQRPRAVHFAQNPADGDYEEEGRNRSGPQTAPPNMDLSISVAPSRGTATRCSPQFHQSFDPDRLPLLSQLPSEPIRYTNHQPLSHQRDLTSQEILESIAPWARKSITRWSSGNRPVHDPRYKSLETALSRAYLPRAQTANIPVVVKQNSSLHLPPKAAKDRKPRLSWKVKQIITERGILV